MAQCDPVFEAESPHLIDQARSRSDHLVSHPVQSLKIGLLFALECSKPHRRPRSCLSDRLRIDDVGFVRLNVGLHELRGDQAHLMSKRLYLPGNPLRSCTRFHPYDCRRRALEEL